MMRRAENICAIGLTSGVAWTAAAGLGHAEPAADPSVLEETWRLATFSDNVSINNPGIEDASLTVDATGTVTGGSWSNSWSETGGFSAGSVAVDTEGEIAGSLTYNGGRTDTNAFSDIQLSPERDVVLGLDNSSDGFRRSLNLGAKAGTGFTTGDLAGTWRFFGFSDDKAPAIGSAEWSRAVVTVNASGAITSGSANDSENYNFSVSGTISITGDVDIDVTLTSTKGSETVFINDLRMALNKTTIGGVFDDNEDVDIAARQRQKSQLPIASEPPS